MASKLPAVKNAAYTFRCVLFAQSDNQIKANPTIAAGDWKVSTDGAAFANLATLPDVDPDSSVQVLVSLSAGEMNGDEIMVTAIDASGAEWHSAAWVIHTAAQTFDTMDTNIDSILADTGTDGVVLADDAITAGKFDESTAFPLKSADTGTTAVARVGADGDTLETLSDQMDATATALGALNDFDPATDLVKLHGTQGAVTFGQVKITASVANEGALHITNAGADSVGLHAQGAGYGQQNIGAYAGAYNKADGANSSGQRNESSGSNGSGQYNYASAAGGSGQYNFGTSVGLTVDNSGGDVVDPMWATNDGIMAALQALVIDGTITWMQMQRIVLAFTGGDTTGGNTAEPAFLGQDGETERIATTMVDGDRTGTVLNGD